jgi:hypothetical protein
MMRLPFADQAIVEEAKLTDYLLSSSHPQGAGKAEFFRRLGFTREQPDVLRQALLRAVRAADMDEILSLYGRKFVGVSTLESPSGRKLQITTVWILRDGDPPPILVTAYPARMEEHS